MFLTTGDMHMEKKVLEDIPVEELDVMEKNTSQTVWR